MGELNSPTPQKTTPLGWLQGWTQRWKRAPRSKADLVQALLAAQQHHIIDMDSRHMLEGVLWMADKTVADVMVAALAPINARFAVLRRDSAAIDAILAKGAARASAIAEPVLADVHRAVGFTG